MRYYVAYGSVRGSCGHRHRTIGSAQRCIDSDMSGCARQGGYSDRYVTVREDGHEVDLTDAEVNEIDYYESGGGEA